MAAKVRCTMASSNRKPVCVLQNGVPIAKKKISELDESDILLDSTFGWCQSKTAKEHKCTVTSIDLADRKWKQVDKEENPSCSVKVETSYLLCTRGFGVIYFVDGESEIRNFAEKLTKEYEKDYVTLEQLNRIEELILPGDSTNCEWNLSRKWCDTYDRKICISSI